MEYLFWAGLVICLPFIVFTIARVAGWGWAKSWFEAKKKFNNDKQGG